KRAGALVLAKTTLGELGGGDAYGTLFGATKNPYSPERTCGGSSGGSAVAVSANLGLVGVGQEGFASIQRPSAWNSIVGMRPSPGLIGRTGMYGGWPALASGVGPMARTVGDLAKVLDCMVGYDPDDPLTSIPPVAPSFDLEGSSERALEGRRIGVLRQTLGRGSDPKADDFKQVAEAFDRALKDFGPAGAEIVDDIEIPGLPDLL